MRFSVATCSDLPLSLQPPGKKLLASILIIPEGEGGVPAESMSGVVQGMGAVLRGRVASVSDVPTPSTEERCATSIRESHEGPVLMAINGERRKQGLEALSKLTVRPVRYF